MLGGSQGGGMSKEYREHFVILILPDEDAADFDCSLALRMSKALGRAVASREVLDAFQRSDAAVKLLGEVVVTLRPVAITPTDQAVV